MEIITHKLLEPIYLPKNFVSLYNDINFCIFDIETTGLNPALNKVILVGICYMKNGKTIIQQFFCNNRKKEYKLLSHLKKIFSSFDLFISYNGNAFDIPFLNKRFYANGLDYKVQTHKNLDLLQFVKKIKHHLKLDNYKLKSLERYLGIQRNDKISGKESVELYNQFEKTFNPSLKKTILLHNYDDLFYMSKTLSILDKVNYKEAISHLPQLFQINNDLVYITKHKIQKSAIHIEGFYETKNFNEYIMYENAFNFQYKFPNFTIKIPLYKNKLPNGNNFLYITIKEFPFDNIYKSLYDYRMDNIVIFKTKDSVHYEKIYLFVQMLIQYIFTKIYG